MTIGDRVLFSGLRRLVTSVGIAVLANHIGLPFWTVFVVFLAVLAAQLGVRDLRRYRLCQKVAERTGLGLHQIAEGVFDLRMDQLPGVDHLEAEDFLCELDRREGVGERRRVRSLRDRRGTLSLVLLSLSMLLLLLGMGFSRTADAMLIARYINPGGVPEYEGTLAAALLCYLGGFGLLFIVDRI